VWEGRPVAFQKLNKKNKHYPFHIGTVSMKVHGVGGNK